MDDALIKRLKCPAIDGCPYDYGKEKCSRCQKTVQKEAAEAIKALHEELEQMKKARDAAIRDLRSCDIDCDFCIHAGEVIDCGLDCEHCAEDCACGKCRNNDLWQWRGGQAKGESGLC